MDKKSFVIIFAISLLFFTPYFIRPNFIGADSYYYVNKVCFDDYSFDRSGLEFLFFDLLPCNFFVLKVLMFVCFFISMVLTGFIVEEFFKDKSWYGVLFCLGLSPILFFSVFKFENDFVGIPLLVLSILFYLKSLKNKDSQLFNEYSIFSLIFLFASSQFLPLSLIFVFIGGVSNWIFMIIGIILLIIFPNQIITQLFPSFFVMETLPLIGITSIFLLVIAFIKPLHKKSMITATLFCLWQGRFMIFIPFLFIPSLINLCETIKPKINLYQILSIWAILGIIAFGILSFTYYPEPETMQITKQGTELQKELDLNFYNDWELGHFVRFYGYDTNYFASPPNPDFNVLTKPFIALTIQSLDCNLVEQTNQYTLYIC